MNVLETINITEKQMAFEKKPNCKFTCAQVIQMMFIFPFFSADFDELLANIINENKRLNVIMRVAQQLQTAA